LRIFVFDVLLYVELYKKKLSNNTGILSSEEETGSDADCPLSRIATYTSKDSTPATPTDPLLTPGPGNGGVDDSAIGNAVFCYIFANTVPLSTGS